MLLSTRDVQAVDQILQEAARVEIMPRFRNLAAHEVRQKPSAMDLVTDADEAADLHDLRYSHCEPGRCA